MTQRNNLHSADLPLRADAIAAASPGQSGSLSSSDARIATPAGRTRKAARIAVSLPIMVRDQFGGQYQARTQFVTVRGAVLTTTSTVRIGHKLTIQNLRSGKSVECHVIALERTVKEGHEVEVEFTRSQPDFWPVQFPADDSRPQETVTSSSLTGNAIELDAATVVTSEFASSISRFSEPEAPKAASHDEGFVLLADSVAADFTPAPTLRSQTTFTPRTAPVDSVAQFRAANRAAHRREQAMKTFYSVLTIVALAGLAFAARAWVSHPSEIAAKLSTVIPKSKAAPPVSNEASKNSLRLVPVTDPKEVKELTRYTPPESNSVAVAEPAVSYNVASKPADRQVAVRHGSSLAALHKNTVQETEEEPLALPVYVGDAGASTKPELLSSVVGQAPIKTAVLAPPSPVPTAPVPQASKQVTPARLVLSAPAQYPSIARQLRTEGEVVIDVDVDASGSVSAAKAVSGPPVLRVAALDAVKRWKYAPATLGGKPIASTQTVKVDFHLK